MNPRKHSRHKQVGLDRLIRVEWLERAANLALAGADATTAKEDLRSYLASDFHVVSGHGRNSLDKTLTVLLRVWVRPPEDLHALCHAGLQIFAETPRREHIALHWGMTMATYPFWGAVAAHVGRLLRLQGMVSHALVRRRIMEKYGQRPTVKDAVRRALRSMVLWGVLEDAKAADGKRGDGSYRAGLTLTIDREPMVAWIAEAFLHSRPNHAAASNTALNAPSLFPFCLTPISAVHLATVSDRLDAFQHGLDQEMIMLRQGSK